MSPAATLNAVIFDVDGTLVDSERDGHRVAFNRAFEEFGLPYRWDPDLYGELLHITGGGNRIDAFLEAQGMPPERRAGLVPRLQARKTEIFREFASGGAVPARPGVHRLLDELRGAGVRVAVATTGTRAWVIPLLDTLFGMNRFELVITAEEAPTLKPDPSAYQLAREHLRVDGDTVVAVEDSRNGLVAAGAAGLRCAVVVNNYTHNQQLDSAAVVLDGFGEPAEPAKVLADPHRLRPEGMLDVALLRRIAAL
ncbi:MAG: HAD-IA family hydrolase [Candidatus Dormibacteria bacterium]